MIHDIYAKAVKKGLEIDSHCSDLYLQVNEVSIKLINDYRFKHNVKTFISEIDGMNMFDIPFAFSPYWDKKERHESN